MQLFLTKLFKGINLILRRISFLVDNSICYVKLYTQNVKFKNFYTKGIPFISIALGGKCIIGFNFKINNGTHNPIGPSQQCVLFVDKNATLLIGDNVGMSQTAIVCHHHITIGNNVKLGGGVCIYDTDFHSINPSIRNFPKLDFEYKKTSPVLIKDNAFIGANSTILKGVIVGENAIIGACSVVTKSIPDNEIWAGNPAKFIKKLCTDDIQILS